MASRGWKGLINKTQSSNKPVYKLVSSHQLNAHFLYSITIYMLHYNPQHVSSNTLLILRRTNCIITASGIVTVCKRPYSMPVESGLQSVLESDSLCTYCETGIPSNSHIINYLPSTVIQLSSLHYPRQHTGKHRAISSKNTVVTATDNARRGSCLLEPNPGIQFSKQDVRFTCYFIPVLHMSMNSEPGLYSAIH